MNKKTKKFFKRNRPQSRRDFGVNICSVNIVSEAEKIIDEYVSKMGYPTVSEKKYKKTAIAAFISLAVTAAAAFLAIKVFLV